MKHYNAGHVWGVVRCFETKHTDGGKPYINIEVDCISPDLGSVRAYGKIWGKDNVEFFFDVFKVGDSIHLKGFVSQFTNRHKKQMTNYNFVEGLKWDPELDKNHKRPKASFILAGEVFYYCDDKQIIKVRIDSPAKENYPAESKEYTLSVDSLALINLEDLPVPGKPYRLKGYLVRGDDDFGDPLPQQAVVFSIAKIKEKDDE